MIAGETAPSTSEELTAPVPTEMSWLRRMIGDVAVRVRSGDIGSVPIIVGVVLVLLVGEIDLSIGSMVGVASAILGTGLAILGWPLYVVVALSILCGVAVGFIYGFVVLRFGVPSFVATLAGLLALLGLQLQ